MMSPKNALASALLVLLTSCAAPVEGYFNTATEVTESWQATMGSAIGPGNGAFVSLDGQTLAVITQTCAVNAYDPKTGGEKWKYAPTDTSLTCNGGLWFTSSYVYFSPSSATSSYVTALNIADGTEFFTTAEIDGVSAGTPVTSSDGKYVVTTSNPSTGKGLFTVFDSADPSTAALNFFTDSRLSAIGAYWMPVHGHYVGGYDNMNDVFYFGLDISLTNMTVGDGQLYAYQAGDESVTLLGGVRLFQSPLAPTVANSGLNMYWSVARSQVRCWTGTEDNPNRTAFHLGSTGSVELERGNPAYLAPKAPPVVTTGAIPFAYGPSAANEIFALNNDCSALSTYTFPDTTLVLSNKVLLSNDELYLYAATPAGEVWFFEAAQLADGPTWNYVLGVPVQGELAISSDGMHIFVPDMNGLVHALLVSDVEHTPVPGSTPNITAPAPTIAAPVGTMPVAAPMMVGTGEPTMSQAPTGTESPSPSGEEPTAPTPGGSGPTPGGSGPTPGGSGPTPPGPAPTPGSSASAMTCFGALVLVAFSMILV